MHILKSHFPTLSEPLDLETFLKDSMKNNKDNMKNNYISFCKQQIDNSRKLSFYSKFKKHDNQEDYLTFIKDPSQRRMLKKFRISNRKLLIEYMTATKNYHAKKDIVKLAIQVQSKTSFTFPSNVQVTITSDTMQTIY